MTHGAAGRIDSGVRLALALHIVLLPLVLGGREPWGLALAASGLLAAWAAWLVAGALRGELRLRSHWLFLIPLALLAMAAAQAVPGAPWVALGPANQARWQEIANATGATPAARLCLAPSRAADAMAVLCLTLAFALLAYQVFGSRRGLLQLGLAVVVAATLNALISYLALFEVVEPPYEALREMPGVMAGTFWNRNHFGQFMALAALQAMGVALAAWFSHLKPSEHGSHLRRYVQVHWQGIAFAATTVALGLGGAELLSLSRGAFLGGSLALLLLLALAWRRSRTRVRPVLMVLGFLLLAFAGGQGALARLADRFDELLGVREFTMDGRVRIWRESLRVLRDHWLAGIGPEAFRSVSQRYEGAWKGEMISFHAHNDWLELLIEYGVPVAALALAAGLLWLGFAMRDCWRQRDPVVAWLGLGAGAALVSVALHSLVDYPLRSPGLLTAASATVVLLALASRFHRERTPSRAWRAPILGRLAWVLCAALLVGLACQSLRQSFGPARDRARLRDLAAARPASLPPSSVVPVNRAAVALGDRILARWPGHVLARKTCGTARHVLALRRWQELIDGRAGVTIDEVDSLLATAVVDLREACLLDPCDGLAQILLAQATEHLGMFRGQIDEPRLRDQYEFAAASSPSIATNVFAAADGLWRSWLRTGQTDMLLRDSALAQFAAAIRLEPRHASGVMERLRDAGAAPADLRALIPPSLVAHEALYSEFERRLLYEDCLAELDAMAALNEARRHQPRPSFFTVDEGDASAPPIADVTDSLARRRLRILGLLGRWSERTALARTGCLRGREEDRRRLAHALRLLDSGSPQIALPLIERVCHEAPDFGESHVQACRALQRLSRDDEALASLLPLVYRLGTSFGEDTYREALAEVRRLAGADHAGQGTSLVAGFLPPALELRATLAAGGTAAEALTARLAELARPGHDGGRGDSWSQAHLASYYLGLAAASRGEAPAAALAFADTLGQCPRHLASSRSLLALPDPAQPALEEAYGQARQLVGQVDALVPLTGPLTSWLELLGFRLRQISSLSPAEVEITVAVLCSDQPSGNGHLALRFGQGPEGAFSVALPLAGAEGDIPAWRVGQVFLRTATVNLQRLSLGTGYLLRPGPYALTVSYQGGELRAGSPVLPAIAGLAFRVDPLTRAPYLDND